MSAISAALEGLQRAQEMFDASARRIASLQAAVPDAGYPVAGPDVVDLSAAVVAMLEARNAYALNAQVLEQVLEMPGTLLDVRG